MRSKKQNEEEKLENIDGTLKFYRDPKKLSQLKKIPASVFSAEVTHRFTEGHSDGSNNRFEAKADPVSGKIVWEDGKIVRTKKKIVNPIYGCHIAPFTVVDPECPAEPGYLVATTGAKWVLIYRCTASTKLKLIQCHSDPGDDLYYSLKFTMFDKTPFLAACGKNGIVRVINVKTGRLHKTFNGAANVLNEIRVHPKYPEIVALASKDMSVHLWNIKSCIQVAIFSSRGLEGHNDEVLIVDFNDDGTKLLSSGKDDPVIIEYACTAV